MAQHFDIAPYQESGYKAALRAVARARRDAQKQGIDLGIPGEGSTADALKAQMGSGSLVGRYLSSGGLGNAAAGLGSVPRGANFGTAFLAAAGGAGRAYQAGQVQRAAAASKAAEDKALAEYRATTSKREQDALDETIRNHKITEAGRGAGGSGAKVTGVAPPGFVGPMPPGEIHQEELPPGIGPEEYPTYRKSRAAALGTKSVYPNGKGRAPSVPKPTPVRAAVMKRIDSINGSNVNDPNQRHILQRIVANPPTPEEGAAAEKKLALEGGKAMRY